jgi:class 3 adenylate cyclase
MNIASLEQKLDALRRFSQLDPQLIERFGTILRELDDWSLLRINPLRFAERHQIAPLACVDLFLYALKVGLVDLEFQSFCPLCGSVEYAYAALDQIDPETFFCSTCGGETSVDLDDHVLASFTINPSIATLGINPHADLESYQRYFFSDVLEYAPERHQLVERQLCAFRALEPGEIWEYQGLLAEPDAIYRVVSLELHATAQLAVPDERPDGPVQGPPRSRIEIDLLPGAISPQYAMLAAGETALHLHNRTNQTLGLYIHLLDHEARDEVLAAHPNRWHSYFSAKMLLNSQTFRELFRIHHLAPGLRLNIQSLTLLFTDLKDSTRLYGDVGDAFAYELVQEHFNLLTQAVRRHAGAVIKTMGDAVMATFNEPQEGVQAALEMLRSIAELNTRIAETGYQLGLKIGMHEGPALAVNADERLDYFGQSVNVAARVQALAAPGELWLSGEIFASPGVEPLLSGAGYETEQQTALLKGVAQPTTVYRCEGAGDRK